MRVKIAVYTGKSEHFVENFLAKGKINFVETREISDEGTMSYIFDFKVNEKYAEIFFRFLDSNRIEHDFLGEDDENSAFLFGIKKKQMRRNNSAKKNSKWRKMITSYSLKNYFMAGHYDSERDYIQDNSRNNDKRFYKRQANRNLRRAFHMQFIESDGIVATKGNGYKKNYDLYRHVF